MDGASDRGRRRGVRREGRLKYVVGRAAKDVIGGSTSGGAIAARAFRQDRFTLRSQFFN